MQARCNGYDRANAFGTIARVATRTMHVAMTLIERLWSLCQDAVTDQVAAKKFDDRRSLLRLSSAGAASHVPLAAAPAGEADGGGGAAALFAVEGEGAAMHLDERLGDGEAEAGAVVAA